MKIRNHLHSCKFYGTPVPIDACGCLGSMLDASEARVAELERAIESWRKEETMWVEREKELNALVDEGIRDIQAEQGYAKRYRDALNVIAQFPDRNSEWLARTAIAALNPAS